MMNMHGSNKAKRIICAIIVIVVCLAMVVPIVVTAL